MQLLLKEEIKQAEKMKMFYSYQNTNELLTKRATFQKHGSMEIEFIRLLDFFFICINYLSCKCL